MTKGLHIAKVVILLAFLLQTSTLSLKTLTVASPETAVEVEPQETVAKVGQTFSITITLSDVQNLFGLDLTLSWKPSVLQTIEPADLRLGLESHSDGVLNEPLFIAVNQASQDEGEYQLAATSTGSATQAFSGSGKIAILTFKVVAAGSSPLDLNTKLASKPLPGSEPEPIPHTDIGGIFNSSQTSQPPIWQNIAVIFAIVLAAIVLATLLLYRKRVRKKTENAKGPASLFHSR